jgi:hypothetical protein
MKYLTFLLCFIPSVAFADYWYLGFTVGTKIHEHTWIGDNPASAYIGRHFQMNDSFAFRVGVEHISNLDKGYPLNEEFETSLDRAYIAGEFHF